MKLAVRGIDTAYVDSIRTGGADANGQPALSRQAVGLANPGRHCLQLIAEGDDKLVLAHRPFASLQPHAALGPIFLHQHGCQRYEAERLPGWFVPLQPALFRGCDTHDEIRCETGDVVEGRDLLAACERILGQADVAYVHIRSRFNCFQCRVERVPT